MLKVKSILNNFFLLIKQIFIVSFTLITLSNLKAQIPKTESRIKIPDWVSQIVNDTVDSKKPRYLTYPNIGFSPETLWEFGLSGLCVFHYKNDTNLRLSEIYAFSFYTQMKQLGLWIDHTIYGKKNLFFFLGKIRFQNYPILYYGIGNQIQSENLAVVPSNNYIIRERLLYRISENIFTGLELDYQHLLNPEFNWSSSVPSVLKLKPSGSQGSRNLGIGFGLLWDSRHNVLNVRDGYLFEIAGLYYPKIFSKSFPMQTLYIDGRRFFSTATNQVLALQFLGQFSAGNIPFNQLSQMGGDMMMRGYYLGKYRDKNYISAQAEYRFLPFNFSKRLGGAVFIGVGSISHTLTFEHLRWVGGGGLRYLIFPKKDIYTRIDIGLEPKGYGIYFYIGEAF